MAPKEKKKTTQKTSLKDYFTSDKKPEVKPDNRILCKYGEKCYQKNSDHHEKFKHSTNSETTQSESSGKEQRGQKRKLDYDFDETPLTTKEADKMIKELFLVTMPEDFYLFWKFCQELNPKCPQGALREAVDWTLVGPFDVLTGELREGKSSDNILRHWRYYYDPPEFQTVIKGSDDTMYHIGYYRDDPRKLPAFVASNAVTEGCHFAVEGENLFAALYTELKRVNEKSDILRRVRSFCKERDICLDKNTASIKARDKKVVTRTFHGAGLVVKLDQNDVGYRPLTESNANLKKILKKIAESKTTSERDKNMDYLQEIITCVQFANDECDYGMGLELGIDLFSFGDPCFHQHILSLLPLAYNLLKRDEFGQIVRAHLEKRERNSDLSSID